MGMNAKKPNKYKCMPHPTILEESKVYIIKMVGGMNPHVTKK